ncbi:MAG TPA: hypothetical protein VL400_02575, partial [Polyangiaceae bacterium]|nr:hypothetical protein [Polyangiaceae bacterium]
LLLPFAVVGWAALVTAFFWSQSALDDYVGWPPVLVVLHALWFRAMETRQRKATLAPSERVLVALSAAPPTLAALFGWMDLVVKPGLDGLGLFIGILLIGVPLWFAISLTVMFRAASRPPKDAATGVLGRVAVMTALAWLGWLTSVLTHRWSGETAVETTFAPILATSWLVPPFVRRALRRD